MIELDRISKSFPGVKSLDGVSFFALGRMACLVDHGIIFKRALPLAMSGPGVRCVFFWKACST